MSPEQKDQVRYDTNNSQSKNFLTNMRNPKHNNNNKHNNRDSRPNPESRIPQQPLNLQTNDLEVDNQDKDKTDPHNRTVHLQIAQLVFEMR